MTGKQNSTKRIQSLSKTKVQSQTGDGKHMIRGGDARIRRFKATGIQRFQGNRTAGMLCESNVQSSRYIIIMGSGMSCCALLRCLLDIAAVASMIMIRLGSETVSLYSSVIRMI